MTTPAGWYPDNNTPGSERYWDGRQWTDQSRPATPAAPAGPPPPGPGSWPPPPAKSGSWFGRHKMLTGIGAVVIIAIIATAASSGGGGGDNVPAKDDQANSISGGSKPAPKSHAGQVLLAVSGNGAKKTQKFTAAADWDLAYTYDCSNFGTQGNFVVMVYGDNNQLSLSNDGPNELGDKGNDVTHNHHGGTYYLDVTSECRWTIKVTSA